MGRLTAPGVPIFGILAQLIVSYLRHIGAVDSVISEFCTCLTDSTYQ